MICEICEQDFDKKGMEKHHLVPKKRERKNSEQKLLMFVVYVEIKYISFLQELSFPLNTIP